MLLTIHNLPVTTRYADIKSLLQSKCGLQHVILDNLVGEGVGKKVTVGVAEDADAAILVRKINGLYWNGQQLYVEDIRAQKSASEQPFRSMNPQPQQQAVDPTFPSMNLQQHSNYNKGMGNMGLASDMMTPAVQPMMAAMYYVPDYTNQDYTKTAGYRQSNFMQTDQSYNQQHEKVQNTYMGISGFSQNATQMSQFALTTSQFNNNQQNFSQPEKQRSGWADSYNEVEDFAAEKPLFDRRSPFQNREVNWFSNQQNRRQESPQRERSRDNLEPSWTPRGSDNRGPRPTEAEFRSTNRPDEHSGFVKPRPDYRPNDRPALLEKFARREFGSNDQGRPNPFSGRPNQFSGRPDVREGIPNERQGRPNEFSDRPNAFSQRPNERQGRPTEFSERQGRPNVFSERQGRPTERPGPSRPNDRAELLRSNERPEFGRSNERPEYSRRGPSERGGRSDRGHARSVFPESRKRKFEESRFEDRRVERPERLSRPDSWRQRPASPPKQFRQHHASTKFQTSSAFLAKKPKQEGPPKPMTEEDKEKLNQRMRMAGVRKTIYEVTTNLGIQDPNLVTRQTFKQFITERIDNVLGDKTMVTPLECFELYRAKYPKTDDKATYDTVLGLIAQRMANEANEIVPEVKPKPKPAAPKPAGPTPSKVPKAERKATKNLKEARHLLAQGKVPTFPLGDKSKVAQHKREEKECYIPEVDAPYKVAIEDELNTIIDLFNRELNNAPTASIQRAYNTVKRAELTNQIKNLLAQSLSRRVSNSGLKVVRIYGCPKLPKREVLEKFLHRFGVQSLRKSVNAKMYTAAVDTYKNLDKLCAMETVKATDGNTIAFKPFHLTPRLKANQALLKVMRKKIIKDMIDQSDLNLLDKDWPAREAEIKKKEAEKQAALEAIRAADAVKQASFDTADAVNEATDGENEVADAEIEAGDFEEATEAEIQAVLNDTKADAFEEDGDLTDNNEFNKELNETGNQYLSEDFHVIDEVNETDSDVEYVGNNTEVVNIDDENEVEADIDDDAEDIDADPDNIDVDIDDVDDDDLEDY